MRGNDFYFIPPYASRFRPAGGTEQWTGTACDVLARYLTGAVVNLIIQVSSGIGLTLIESFVVVNV